MYVLDGPAKKPVTLALAADLSVVEGVQSYFLLDVTLGAPRRMGARPRTKKLI